MTIDLHGQHVKEGMMILKYHLAFGVYGRCKYLFRQDIHTHTHCVFDCFLIGVIYSSAAAPCHHRIWEWRNWAVDAEAGGRKTCLFIVEMSINLLTVSRINHLMCFCVA